MKSIINFLRNIFSSGEEHGLKIETIDPIPYNGTTDSCGCGKGPCEKCSAKQIQDEVPISDWVISLSEENEVLEEPVVVEEPVVTKAPKVSKKKSSSKKKEMDVVKDPKPSKNKKKKDA